MHNYVDQKDATRILAAGQTHDDMHGGRGVVEMPTHERTSRRAHEIYLQSGRKQGKCEQNWHQAERELRAADQFA